MPATQALPALLIAAHGTASVAGTASTLAVVDAVAAARPDVAVSLCFLDVAAPRLADALSATPTVVVPLLLSAGFHVLEDIPAAVAGHPQARVARHLGPDPLVIDVLVERLASARGSGPVSTTVLVGAGSRNPAAAHDLARAGELLAARLGREVRVLTLGDDVRGGLAAAVAAPLEVATYLLGEGQFVDTLRAAAAGLASVSDPIGAHPALAALVLARYDEVLSVG